MSSQIKDKINKHCIGVYLQSIYNITNLFRVTSTVLKIFSLNLKNKLEINISNTWNAMSNIRKTMNNYSLAPTHCISYLADQSDISFYDKLNENLFHTP